jgi:glycosyltransferase involved in cell wall biosynthesis
VRIIHYPTDTGGNPTGLARAERALGADSTAAVFHRSWLEYPVDIDLGLSRTSRLARLPGRIRFARRAFRSYDVFHFNFGQSLLPMIGPVGIDLQLLRRAGKRIFFTFQGDDARPAGVHARPGERPSLPLRLRRRLVSRVRAWRAAYASRWADRVFTIVPELVQYVPRAEFVPYASVDLERIRPANGHNPRPVVAHAPTDRLIKGTEHVLAAAKRLEGTVDLEWMLVEKLPHAEALDRLRRADLVIDQLRLGWYGAFAVEMMAMGKPVICHITDDRLRPLPPAMAAELPIVRATPENLAEVVADLAGDPQSRAELGRRGRQFVERWHDPRRIARAMLAVYRDPSVAFWDAF